jgi:hypothetical protein
MPHVSATLVAIPGEVNCNGYITVGLKAAHKCKIISFKIYGLKCILKYKISRVLLVKPTIFQLVEKFLAFMEPESSLPHSQVPATCPYPEPKYQSRSEAFSENIS